MILTEGLIDKWISLPETKDISALICEHFTSELYQSNPLLFEDLADKLMRRVFCMYEDGQSLISYNDLETAAATVMHLGEVSNYKFNGLITWIQEFPRGYTELFKTRQAIENPEVRQLLLENVSGYYLLDEIGCGKDGPLAQVCPYVEIIGAVPYVVRELHKNYAYLPVGIINNVFNSVGNFMKDTEVSTELGEKLSFLLTLRNVDFGSGIKHIQNANDPISAYEYARVHTYCSEVMGHSRLNTLLQMAELTDTLGSYDCWKHAIDTSTKDETVALPCDI